MPQYFSAHSKALKQKTEFTSCHGKKKPDDFSSGLQKKAGVVLLSHTVTCAIPSPQEGLTSEFGMGSGVAPLLKTPAKGNKI